MTPLYWLKGPGKAPPDRSVQLKEAYDNGSRLPGARNADGREARPHIIRARGPAG